MDVDLGWVFILFSHESVKLVEHETSFDFGVPRLSDHGLRLWRDSLHTVNYDEGTIGERHCRVDLNRKIDMARRVNQINQVVLLLNYLVCLLSRCPIPKNESNRARLHCDLSLLLVFSRVKVPYGAGRLGGNYVVGADETI